MTDKTVDPFLGSEVRSNTDDSLENYSFKPVQPELEQLKSPQEYQLTNLESPTTMPMFNWQQTSAVAPDAGQQMSYGTMQGMPPAPSLSVEQFYAQRTDTGGSAEFPMPNAGPVGLGLSPNAVFGRSSGSSLDESDEYSDFSSDHSTSPQLVRDGSGYLVPPGKQPSDPSLLNSRSYENLLGRSTGEIHHNAAGLLATTIPRAPSPHLILMSSPMIRAIPSPQLSASPSPSPGSSPASAMGVSPLASQMSMFDLNRQSRGRSPEQVLEDLIKMEQPYLQPNDMRGASGEIKAPKSRKREMSAEISGGEEGEPGTKSTRQTLYACPYPGCGKNFTRPYNLKSHYRSHTGERPYACSSCTLTFSRKHDLKRHEKLHTGAKPFTCIACQKSFARSDALARHLKSEPGKESPCATRISLMNAKEKFAEAQSMRDDQMYVQQAALGLSDQSSPSEMSAASPAYSAVSPQLVYAIPSGQPGINYFYQAIPSGSGQPMDAQFIQAQQAMPSNYQQVNFVDPQLSFAQQAQPRSASPRR